MAYKIDFHKEEFKFSASHFTVFNAQQAERLHGHNYYVTCSLEFEKLDPKVGLTFDFNLIKPFIKSACNELDEYVLIPSKSEYVQVSEAQGNWIVRFAQKTYSFPKLDVKMMPLVNITSEGLSQYLADQLITNLPKNLNFKSISVCVSEVRGQSATYTQSVFT